MGGTSRSQTVSTRLQWVAQQAVQYPQMVFTTLAHHMDVEWLREAYRLTPKDRAAGVDGVTAKHYRETRGEPERLARASSNQAVFYTTVLDLPPGDLNSTALGK